MESGKTTNLMVRESNASKMGPIIRDSSRMERNMGREYSLGQKGKFMMDSSKMDSCMARANFRLNNPGVYSKEGSSED